jgi:hypothetical protein
MMAYSTLQTFVIALVTCECIMRNVKVSCLLASDLCQITCIFNELLLTRLTSARNKFYLLQKLYGQLSHHISCLYQFMKKADPLHSDVYRYALSLFLLCVNSTEVLQRAREYPSSMYGPLRYVEGKRVAISSIDVGNIARKSVALRTGLNMRSDETLNLHLLLTDEEAQLKSSVAY